MTNAAKQINEANLSCGQVLVALSASGAGAEIPKEQEIKIAPRGTIKCRDGRVYEIDPEALVARFEADGTDIAIDIEHALSSKDGNKQAGASGWVKKLLARDDGVYGLVEWGEDAIAALQAKKQKYVSPTFPHDKSGKAIWLHSVSLVAAPALGSQTALANAQPHDQPLDKEQPMSFAKLAAKLGLNEEASEDAMIAALETLAVALAVGILALSGAGWVIWKFLTLFGLL